MAQSSKRGVRSDSQKTDNARHDFDPAPASAPVEGAFGRNQQDSEQVQSRPTYDRESERSER